MPPMILKQQRSELKCKILHSILVGKQLLQVHDGYSTIMGILLFYSGLHSYFVVRILISQLIKNFYCSNFYFSATPDDGCESCNLNK